MSRTHSGTLKQQVIDGSTGDYEWVRRNFQLVVGTGMIHVKSVDVGAQPIPSISIVDAAYAKAWSISSAAVGFGFDIVWESGTIASFLSSDKDSCHMWVHSLNESIRTFSDSGGEEESDGSDVSEVAVNFDLHPGGRNNANTRPPLPPSVLNDSGMSPSPMGAGGRGGAAKAQAQAQALSDSGAAGGASMDSDQGPTRDSSQWVDQGDTSTTRVLPSPPRGGASVSSASASASVVTDNQSELSAIPAIGAEAGPGSAGRNKGHKRSADGSQQQVQTAGGSYIFDSPQRQQKPQNQGGQGQQFNGNQQNAAQYQQMMQNMSNSNISGNNNVSGSSNLGAAGAGPGGAGGVAGGAGVAFEGGDDSLLFQLQQKCLRLQAKAEREAIDAQVGREQLVKLQTELDQRSAQYSRDMDKALEREKCVRVSICV